MSQDQQQMPLPGDGSNLMGPLDVSSGSQMQAAAMFKAAQLQQQNQLGQEQSLMPRGSYGGTSSDFGMLPPQPMNAMFGVNMGGGDQQIQQSQQELQQDLKRLNDAFGGSAGPMSNALLMTGSSSSGNPNNAGNMNSSSLLQSFMLDQQQRMMGMQQQQQPQHQSNKSSLGGLGSPVLQPVFFQDPRVFAAQSQMPSLPRQFENPLPSPHSLFHRDGSRRMRGGVIEPYPEKLHRLLTEVEAAGRSDVISWVANGRAFSIHKPDKFFKEIVPLYFRQSRLSSFKRQLNLYGFELINSGPARGAYFHELFVKNHPELCRRMRRVAVKVGGKKDKLATLPTDQPQGPPAPLGPSTPQPGGSFPQM